MHSLKSLSRPLGSSICSRNWAKKINDTNSERQYEGSVSTEQHYVNIRVKSLKEFYEETIQNKEQAIERNIRKTKEDSAFDDTFSTRLRVRALIQLYEYSNLLKKDVPPGLLTPERSMPIRYYSKKGYPWNTVCKHSKNITEPCRNNENRKSQNECMEESKCEDSRRNPVEDNCNLKCKIAEDVEICSQTKCTDESKSKCERLESVQDGSQTKCADESRLKCERTESVEECSQTKCADENRSKCERAESVIDCSQTRCADESNSKGKSVESIVRSSENQCTDDKTEGDSTSAKDKKKTDISYGISSVSSYRFTPKEKKLPEVLNRRQMLQQLDKEDDSCKICLNKSFDDCSFQKPTHMIFKPINVNEMCQQSACDNEDKSGMSCMKNSKRQICHTQFSGCVDAKQYGTKSSKEPPRCSVEDLKRKGKPETKCPKLKKAKSAVSCESVCKKTKPSCGRGKSAKPAPYGGAQKKERESEPAKCSEEDIQEQCGKQSKARSSPCGEDTQRKKAPCGTSKRKSTCSSEDLKEKSCQRKKNPCGEPASVNISQKAVKRVNKCRCNIGRKPSSRKGINIMKPTKSHCGRVAEKNPCGSPGERHKKKSVSCKSQKPEKDKECRMEEDEQPKCEGSFKRVLERRKITGKKQVQAKVVKLYKKGVKKPKRKGCPSYPWNTVYPARPFGAAEVKVEKKKKKSQYPSFKCMKKKPTKRSHKDYEARKSHRDCEAGKSPVGDFKASKKSSGKAKLNAAPSSSKGRYPWNSDQCTHPEEECSSIPKRKPSIKTLKKIAERNKKQMSKRGRGPCG